MDEQNVAGKYKNIRPNADTFKHMMEILQGNPKSSSTSHQTKELYDEVKIKYPDLLKTAEVQPFLRDYSKKNESKWTI